MEEGGRGTDCLATANHLDCDLRIAHAISNAQGIKSYKAKHNLPQDTSAAGWATNTLSQL